jgi:hypothetical protein
MSKKRLLGVKLGPVGLTLAAWDVYRRLPPRYRRQFRSMLFKHGPRVAAAGAKRYRDYRRTKR